MRNEVLAGPAKGFDSTVDIASLTTQQKGNVKNQTVYYPDATASKVNTNWGVIAKPDENGMDVGARQFHN